MRTTLLHVALLVFMGASSANAQVLIANDNSFGIPFGEALVVEPLGVLDNDTLDGEAAGENGATSELVTDVSHGVLVFSTDGSFTYTPGTTFDGSDQFTYRALFDTVADTALVTLSACMGGPELFTCWNESAFLAKAAESSFSILQESFESDVDWGDARNPLALPSVTSRGIQWQTNHADPPASNLISTGSGAARTGLWGIYDPSHGYATGSEVGCDIDNPADSCLYNDGFTGTVEPGLGALHGVGGFTHGTYGINVGIVLDGGLPIGGGKTGGGYQFFGVIDTSPAGFTRFEFRELDGKIGQALYVFGDDFTLVGLQPTAAPEPSVTRAQFRGASPNPFVGNTVIYFATPQGANTHLAIYDLRGRLVRILVDGILSPGTHAIDWDGRDRDGITVSAGIYFGRLRMQGNGTETVQNRKIVVLR